MEKYYVKLEPSEHTLLNASAQILSAFIRQGLFTEQKEKELVEKSVRLAINLVEKIEALVVADDEIP
jgi:hypothetical protein